MRFCSLRKRMIVSFLMMSLCSLVLAKTPTGYSFVILTNDTKTPLKIQVDLKTDDLTFKKGRDWEANSLTLQPYESKQVLWFSRNFNVKPNQLYQFDMSLTHLDKSKKILFSVIEKGKNIFGSEVYAELGLPDQPNQKILTEHSFENLTKNFWDNSYQIFLRSWMGATSLFNNYHFTIHEIDNKIIDTHLPQTLSVISYNTQLMPFYADAVNNLNQPAIRALDIPAKIANVDVVILEELFDRDLRISIMNVMNKYYPYHSQLVGYHTNKALSGGVMIFSKWPIINEDQMIYRASSGIDSLAAKGAAFITINKMGIIYHVFGTHLQAGNSENDIKSRTMQLQELANFINNKAISSKQAIIIGGDFNIDSQSTAAQLLENILNVSLPSNLGHPFSSDGLVNMMSTSNNRSRIDYLFFKRENKYPKVTFNKVMILRDLENEKMWPNFEMSDHFPVLGYFVFNEL